MIAALDTANGRLGYAQQVSGFLHGKPFLRAPLSQIHAGNIRVTNDTSTVFYASGGLPPGRGGAQYSSMGKKSKKKRPHFVKAWRKHRGLTQEQLAERLGMTQATIARIERGDIAYTQPVLEALADALRCEPADLIMRDPTQDGSIWSIWDQIPATERPRVTQILETFTKKAG